MNESSRRRHEVDIQRTYEEIRYHSHIMATSKNIDTKDRQLRIIRERERHLARLKEKER